MANPHGDNVNKTAPTEKTEPVGKAAAESAVNTWSKGATETKSGDKAPHDSVATKAEEHGFLNIDFKGMGDAFNQALHNTQEMISSIGKKSPEQAAADAKAAEAKLTQENFDKGVKDAAQNIAERMGKKQLSYDSTTTDINKELHAMDSAKRQAVLEELKHKPPFNVKDEGGQTKLVYGGAFGIGGESVYP